MLIEKSSSQKQERENLFFQQLAPRWCKVIRDLWQYKTRTVLVVLSIALGVLGVGMISGSQAVLSSDLVGAYLAQNPRHATLFTEGFDHGLVAVVKRMPEIADAEGRRTVNARVQLQSGQWQNLELIAVADFRDVRINRFAFLRGEWPPPKRTLLIERASLTALGYDIGQSVSIKLPNGKDKSLTISGSVHDLNQVPPLFSGDFQGYISLDTLESLGYARTFDELHITVAENQNSRRHILSVAETVTKKVEKSGRLVYGDFVPRPGDHWSGDSVNSMLFLLNALGVLTLLLSGFLVVNTTSALLTQQIGQIGVMKAIGANARQLFGLYMGMVFLFGLLALVVAIPLSLLGTWSLTQYVADLLNFDVASWGITPSVLLLQTSVGLLIPLIAALIPIFKGTRITVREAISFQGLSRAGYGRGLLDRLIHIIRGFPRPVLLSLRNTFRRKGRLALVLITLSLASAIFISVLSVQDSLRITLDDAMRYWHYDVELYFGRDYRLDELNREALTVPGVDSAEAWGFENVVRMRTEDEQSDRILMIAPTAGTSLIDPILLAGRWLHPEDGNAVVINTELLQDEPDLKVGDTMVMRIDDRDSNWQIVGLIRQPLSGPYVYVNYSVYSQIKQTRDRANNLRIVTKQHHEEYQNQVAQLLETQFESRGYKVSSTQTTIQDRRETENELNVIVVFLLIMAVLLAIVGGLGLMGTMSINVMERTREVGVMRAIGAPHSSIWQIVIVEGVVIGLLSWAIGTAISIPLGQLLSDQVGLLFLGTPGPYLFSQAGAVLWFGVVLAIAVVASFLPAWSASRLSVRETLAYQ